MWGWNIFSANPTKPSSIFFNNQIDAQAKMPNEWFLFLIKLIKLLYWGAMIINKCLTWRAAPHKLTYTVSYWAGKYSTISPSKPLMTVRLPSDVGQVAHCEFLQALCWGKSCMLPGMESMGANPEQNKQYTDMAKIQNQHRGTAEFIHSLFPLLIRKHWCIISLFLHLQPSLLSLSCLVFNADTFLPGTHASGGNRT